MMRSVSMLALALSCALAGAAHAQKPADPNKALLVEVKGEVSAKGADGASAAVAQGAELAKGVELTTGVDSEAKLAFSDGTVMVVNEMTQIMISDLLSKGSRQAVQVQLKLGEVSAKVNPKHAFESDFKISTPTGTASVRGTEIKSIRSNSMGMDVELRSGALRVEGRGAVSDLGGGDAISVDPDTNAFSTPLQTQAENSRVHVEPPVTGSEAHAIAVRNQPLGAVPKTSTESATTGSAAASFVFRFQKQ